VEGREELREAIRATRSTVKAAMRANRTALQFLADLEEKLDDAQPEEAQRDDRSSSFAAAGR